MSYYLQWPPSNGWVSAPDWYPSSPDNWSFEVDIRTPSTVSGDKTVIGQEDSTASRCWKLFINNGNIGIIHNSNWSGGGFVVTPVSASTRYLVRGEFDGDEIRLYLNDVLAASASGRNLSVVAAKSHLSFIGRSGSSGASVITDLALYRARFWDDSTQSLLAIDYNKQALSGSNDIILPDAVSGNDGTLINFPTDNSQWVFFDDGGGSTVTADTAFSVSIPVVSASASATLVQPSANVSYNVSSPAVNVSVSASLPQPLSGIAFTVNAPAITGDVSASLPQPQSDVVFAVNAPSVSSNASATIPGYNVSVSFTVNIPSVSADASVTRPSPTADITYTVNAPSISAQTAASLPQPDSGVAFTVNAPTVAATTEATQTGYNADIAFSVNAPSVSISASATLPQPESTVTFSVPPPQVGVIAIVGEIAIIVDDETNINQRVLSNNINAPILSNNIKG